MRRNVVSMTSGWGRTFSQRLCAPAMWMLMRAIWNLAQHRRPPALGGRRWCFLDQAPFGAWVLGSGSALRSPCLVASYRGTASHCWIQDPGPGTREAPCPTPPTPAPTSRHIPPSARGAARPLPCGGRGAKKK